ncbi:MAG: sodium:proton antiporter [Candidatus Micrarchaeota archaeon]|nr:sodium:proton antiporter [Candidatus Micrarchaeota archaeon]
MIDATIEIALTFFAILMVAAQLIALRFRIPYTLVFVFLGIAITALSTIVLFSNPLLDVLQLSVQWIRSIYGQLVGSGLFVGLIVPPLLFEAMMHIKKRELSAVIKPSIVLATIGVLLSTAVAGFLIWQFEDVSIFTAFIFAAIISPTDTITVLQTFKQVNVPHRLATLVDMEAAFNDATAIVLFTILVSYAGVQRTTLFGGVEYFVYSFFGGAVIGMVVALLSRMIHARVDDKLAETTLTIAAVYGSYVMATALGASGLIAVAIVGLYFGNSTLNTAVSKRVRGSIVSFWEIAAFVGNAVAFLLIGFETNLTLFYQAAGIILVAYASTVIARAVTVYPTFAVFNRLGAKMPFSWGNIAFLGGVRGALSIALLATLAASGTLSGSEMSILTAMVLGVVFISLVVQVPLLSNYAAKLFGRHRKPKDLQ